MNMNIVDRASLSATLDRAAEALFFRWPLSAAERTAMATWVAGRQGLSGAYAGMFAPTPQDASGIRLFTGELVRSRLGIAHLLGEEGCRVLAALNVKVPVVRAALGRAIAGMAARLEETERRGLSTGLYCCGTCSAGYWRNLAPGLFPRAGERLRQGLGELKRLRRRDGTWRRFPFYYTSLALTEIGPELAGPEMRHAARHWRVVLPRLAASSGAFARRRLVVGRRLLAQCET